MKLDNKERMRYYRRLYRRPQPFHHQRRQRLGLSRDGHAGEPGILQRRVRGRHQAVYQGWSGRDEAGGASDGRVSESAL